MSTPNRIVIVAAIYFNAIIAFLGILLDTKNKIIKDRIAEKNPIDAANNASTKEGAKCFIKIKKVIVPGPQTKGVATGNKGVNIFFNSVSEVPTSSYVIFIPMIIRRIPPAIFIEPDFISIRSFNLSIAKKYMQAKRVANIISFKNKCLLAAESFIPEKKGMITGNIPIGSIIIYNLRA